MKTPYPNNPAADVAPLAFYERMVDFCRRQQVILAHDSASCEMYYDEAANPLSVFNVPGARDVAMILCGEGGDRPFLSGKAVKVFTGELNLAAVL